MIPERELTIETHCTYSLKHRLAEARGEHVQRLTRQRRSGENMAPVATAVCH